MKELRSVITIFFLLFFASNVLYNQEVFASNDIEALKSAASKYWNSRLTGDVLACYQLEEPGFRKKVPLSQYAKAGNIIYKDVKVDEVEIQKDVGTVKVKISYIIPALGSRVVFPDTVVDKWKKVEGEWYHVIRQGNPLNNKNSTKKPKGKEVMNREAQN